MVMEATGEGPDDFGRSFASFLLIFVIGILLSLTTVIIGIFSTTIYLRKSKVNDPITCPACSYDMRGSFANGSAVCPECGHVCDLTVLFDHFGTRIPDVTTKCRRDYF